MNISEEIAKTIQRIHFDDIPQKTIEKAKVAILDWLGVTFCGAKDSSSIILVDAIKKFSGPKQAMVIGQNFYTDIINASLLNGYFSHVLDYDDIHLGLIGHPSAPVLPALFALGEWRHLSGKDLMCSYIIGVEVECMLAEAINPEHYEQGWHSTATLGHLGAAAGSGKLMGLGEKHFINALGIAGTTAAGLREVFGSMSKPFQIGKAASDGLMGAILAEQGITSAKDILGGKKGIISVMGKECNTNEIFHNFGRSWQIDNIIFKKHASCYRTHAVIECALSLKEKLNLLQKNIESIESIVCKIPPLAWDMAKILIPKNKLEGKFSQPFCLAVSLLEGHATERVFTHKKIKNNLIIEIMEKTSVQVKKYLKSTEAIVEIKLDDGKIFNKQIDTEALTKGSEEIISEVIEKFKNSITCSKKGCNVEMLIKSVLNLEKTKDLKEIIHQLAF